MRLAIGGRNLVVVGAGVDEVGYAQSLQVRDELQSRQKLGIC